MRSVHHHDGHGGRRRVGHVHVIGGRDLRVLHDHGRRLMDARFTQDFKRRAKDFVPSQEEHGDQNQDEYNGQVDDDQERHGGDRPRGQPLLVTSDATEVTAA